MNDRSEKFRNLLVPVLSVVLGLILGAILMAAFGFQPIQGYSSMLDAALGSQRGIGETLRQATPLIFTALGFSVANSAGFFNIGLSGQALCGWIVSVWVALFQYDQSKCLTAVTMVNTSFWRLSRKLRIIFSNHRAYFRLAADEENDFRI